MEQQVAKFYKVSKSQFVKDVRNCGISFDEAVISTWWENIKLPTRATTGSAGYDFYLPFTISTNTVWNVIPSGIRCEIDNGWMLSLYPKSGLGFKYRMKIANTIGIVDSDYAFSDNEGHIMVSVASEVPHTLESGSKFVQGIFLPYGIVLGDNAFGTRNGGFGSTGDK